MWVLIAPGKTAKRDLPERGLLSVVTSGATTVRLVWGAAVLTMPGPSAGVVFNRQPFAKCERLQLVNNGLSDLVVLVVVEEAP